MKKVQHSNTPDISLFCLSVHTPDIHRGPCTLAKIACCCFPIKQHTNTDKEKETDGERVGKEEQEESGSGKRKCRNARKRGRRKERDIVSIVRP